MRKLWTRYAFGVAALALMLVSGSVSAWQCDFLTGGGFIIRDSGAKANFGVGAAARTARRPGGIWSTSTMATG